MLIIAMSIFILLIIAAGLFMLRIWENGRDKRNSEFIDTSDQDDVIENRVRYDGQWYVENEYLEKTLIIGLDKFDTQLNEDEEGFTNDQQSDFLALMIKNRKDGSYKTVFLNRDTMAEVPMLDVNGNEYGSRTMQLALAHTYGNGREISCRNTVKAVSNLLYGVKIDHYVSLTMDAVKVINDAVGGVTVYVEDDFSNSDPSIVQGEYVTLLGDHALNYVRARMEMAEPTNLARMERQRAYLKALRLKLLDSIEANDRFAFDTLMEINSYLVSDCSINTLAGYIDTISKNEEPEILTLKGEAVAGEKYMEYYVDEEELQKNVIDWFFMPLD